MFQRFVSSVIYLLSRGLTLGGKNPEEFAEAAKVIWWSASDRSHQMSYNDPESLKLRYDHILAEGMRGVGSWHITCLGNGTGKKEETMRAAVWSVIPTGK